ncbi:hypothetical protein SAFG77S_10518 [Streptomyces afghaniensis]
MYSFHTQSINLIVVDYILDYLRSVDRFSLLFLLLIVYVNCHALIYIKTLGLEQFLHDGLQLRLLEEDLQQ